MTATTRRAASTPAFLAAALLLFTVLTAAMTFPQLLHMRDGVSDEGDPMLVTWVFAWVAHQLPVAPAHLFDANIFYPERRTLAFSETLLAPSAAAGAVDPSGAVGVSFTASHRASAPRRVAGPPRRLSGVVVHVLRPVPDSIHGCGLRCGAACAAHALETARAGAPGCRCDRLRRGDPGGDGLHGGAASRRRAHLAGGDRLERHLAQLPGRTGDQPALRTRI